MQPDGCRVPQAPWCRGLPECQLPALRATTSGSQDGAAAATAAAAGCGASPAPATPAAPDSPGGRRSSGSGGAPRSPTGEAPAQDAPPDAAAAPGHGEAPAGDAPPDAAAFPGHGDRSPEAPARDAPPDATAIPGHGQQSPEAAAGAPDAASPDSTAAGGGSERAAPPLPPRGKLGIPDAWQGITDSSDDEVPLQTHAEVRSQSASRHPVILSLLSVALVSASATPSPSALSPYPTPCLNTLCVLTLRHSSSSRDCVTLRRCCTKWNAYDTLRLICRASSCVVAQERKGVEGAPGPHTAGFDAMLASEGPPTPTRPPLPQPAGPDGSSARSIAGIGALSLRQQPSQRCRWGTGSDASGLRNECSHLRSRAALAALS